MVMTTLKNGHQFHRSKEPDPREKHPPATGGDWSCVLCGSWTTYCMSAELADEKMGKCPNRKEATCPSPSP